MTMTMNSMNPGGASCRRINYVISISISISMSIMSMRWNHMIHTNEEQRDTYQYECMEWHCIWKHHCGIGSDQDELNMNYEYRCYVFVLLLVFCFLSLYVECMYVCMYVGSKPEGDLNCFDINIYLYLSIASSN